METKSKYIKDKIMHLAYHYQGCPVEVVKTFKYLGVFFFFLFCFFVCFFLLFFFFVFSDGSSFTEAQITLAGQAQKTIL